MKRESFSYHFPYDLLMFQCSLSAHSLFATCAVVIHISWSCLQATIFCGLILSAIRYDVCGERKKMIGSCCHKGCPMNGQNEIPKMLCTRHKVSQGRPYDTLRRLFNTAWISLCSGIGHVYVKGKVVQFTDVMRFVTRYVNVTKGLPGTKYKQNSHQTVRAK